MEWNRETKGVALALLTAITAGIATPANKWFLVSLDPLLFTAIRSILCGIFFLALSYWFWSKEERKKSFAVSWNYLFAIAFIGGAIAFWLFFSGLKLTTAIRGTFLHKTLPLYVVVLSYFFLREKITRKHLIGIGLMVLGTAAIYFTQISPSDLWANPQLGDLMVLGAAALWGIETVLSKKAMIQGETNWMVSFARMFFGGLILFGFMILLGKTSILLSLTAAQWFNILMSTFLLLLYVLFFYWSLQLINASKAAMYLLLAPVISLFIGILFLGEPAPAMQWIGSAIILLGCYLLSRLKSETRSPNVSISESRVVN